MNYQLIGLTNLDPCVFKRVYSKLRNARSDSLENHNKSNLHVFSVVYHSNYFIFHKKK